jgi:uncharacterized integral membrane protein (TIGR00698 family)
MVVAALAFGCAGIVPFVGAPVFGVLLGVLAAVPFGRAARGAWKPGIQVAGKTVLQASVVLLGATIDFGEISRTSAASLPVMLGTLALALVAAAVLGRLLGLDPKMRTLIGVGTSICGVSAIAAVAPVIAADESAIAYAITTIFIFNVAAVLAFPPLGHLLGMSPGAFGLWAGTAINDTSSVVAAGYAFAPLAATAAVIVKLTRTLLIIPIVLALVARKLLAGRREVPPVPWRRLVPPFMIWFVVAVGINSLGIVPVGAHAPIAAVALGLIVVALAGVGLSSDFAAMRRAGVRPVLFGGLLWIVVALSSLALQAVTARAF